MFRTLPNPVVLAAAVLAGASYWPGAHWIEPGAVHTLWKASGVALLALWAAISVRSGAGRWIAAVLALGALGDALLETAGLSVGAVAFLVGHLVASGFYWSNRRRDRDGSAMAFVLMLGIPLLSWSLSGKPGVLLYGLALGAMVTTAWISRFPRRSVALGALLFAGSDLLIFAGMGPLVGSPIPGIAVWPLYFAGQALIAYGVVTTLQAERTA